jgi:hypothetical protein
MARCPAIQSRISHAYVVNSDNARREQDLLSIRKRLACFIDHGEDGIIGKAIECRSQLRKQ